MCHHPKPVPILMNRSFSLFALSLLFLSFQLFGCSPDRERPVRSVEFSVEQGTNMAAALSPDGSEIALALQGQLWLLPADGGEAELLAGPLSDVLEPAWSPDGRRIAFHSYVDGNFRIWSVERDGSGMRQLTDGIHDDREPVWSPDGETILFSSDRSGSYDLWRVNASGGEPEQVTAGERDEYHPAFSPDGNRIVFVSGGPEPELQLLEEGESRSLVTVPFNPSALSWSPDGERLYFHAYGRGASYSYLYDIGTGELEMVSRGEEDLFPFRAGWLSGSEVLYTADGGIRIRDLRDGGVSEVPFRVTFSFEREGHVPKVREFDGDGTRAARGLLAPVVSPDGDRVAYSALGDLYVGEQGREPVRLTSSAAVDLYPDWSPDGRRIAFVSDRSGEMELHLIDPESGDVEKVAPGYFPASSPSWSPDGERIAFLRHTHLNQWGSAEVLEVRLSDGAVRRLYGPLFGPGKPTWSPDSRTVALMALDRRSGRYREGFNRFLMIDPEGGSARFVSPERERSLGMRHGSGPVWSPDGERIAYIQDGLLRTVPVDGRGNITGEHRIVSTLLADQPSWNGDSSELVFLNVDRLVSVGAEGGEEVEFGRGPHWEPKRSDERYVIRAGRLFDGVNDGYRENVDIVIAGNRIESIEAQVPGRDKRVIDVGDRVVMPGLFEMHSHQNSMAGERLGRIWLAYGITSVREPGADPYDALERSESWESGTRPGPRLFFTGPLTDGSRVYYSLANSVTDPEHLNLELERIEALDYDLVKTYVRMPDSIQEEIVRAAHRLGIPVSSHELFPALTYGVDAVEHLRGTSRRGYSLKLTARNRSYEDVILSLAHAGMSVTPTVVMHGGYLMMANRHPELLDDLRKRALFNRDVVELFAERAAEARYDSDFGMEGETEPGGIQEAIRAVVEAGGTVTAGTDSPFVPFGSSLHAELWLYVDGGLTPYQALQSATIRAAEAVGVADRLGSVEAGKLADLIVVRGDPLRDIRDAMNLEMVVRDGRPTELDELLEDR